jgi:hypothetical protein
MPSILNPAPPWSLERSAYVSLWHGCLNSDRVNIEENGIDPTLGRVDADFGRGFYTTTVERQARQWAWQRFLLWNAGPANESVRNQPVVMRFRVPRHGRKGRIRGLDRLFSLHFVLAGSDNEDYWSFVQHCRQSTAEAFRDHGRPPSGWYDLVTGPVSAFWQQRVAMQDSDQVGFHTSVGAEILNKLIRSGRRGETNDYSWSFVYA